MDHPPKSPSLVVDDQSIIPVIPIRNAVLFPSVSMPLAVGRERSVHAVEAVKEGSLVLVITQKAVTVGDPSPEDLYRVGTICRVDGIAASDSSNRQIVVSGISRFRVTEFKDVDGQYLAARGEALGDRHDGTSVRNEALFHHLKSLAREILELIPGGTESLIGLIDRMDDPVYLGHVCSAYLNLSVEQKQELLEMDEVECRLGILLSHMQREREVLSLQREMREKLSERLTKAQRDALLREQLRTIQTELGDEGGENVVNDLEVRIAKAELPEEALHQARDELKRLRGMSPNSAEYQVARTYVEWLSDLPWNRRSNTRLDIQEARRILDEDHYGLEAVKKRILQFLAVAKLKNDLHGPILCLVGPPGVGKTSLGQSIARALDRKFTRAALGGVRDEAEIRGHRRTYVGAMPGRIIQCIKRAGTRNPLMMLDEIDKLYADFHGDPSAALLEVLDPEQNRTFVDHYIDVAFDLSDVFFIATGNVVDTIPPALRDRMEIIEVSGYTSFEKFHIARRHLIPRLLAEHGLKAEWVTLDDEALETIISRYTREAGVRELQRKIAGVFRAVAERIVDTSSPAPSVRVTKADLMAMLGPERHYPEMSEGLHRPGIAIGLAWTPQGGEILYIEATALPEGHGHLTLTGQLGEVMKESAMIAVSLARYESPFLSNPFRFHRHDIHVHVPAGAIPKDGPSAGLAILAAISSMLANRSLRPGLAMTGEITLRGSVMPVGGIREKILAARRAGVREVILPKRNEADLLEVPEAVRNELKLTLVSTVEEALQAAFESEDAGVAALRPVSRRSAA
jgi:ATP-dependent Lon protease